MQLLNVKLISFYKSKRNSGYKKFLKILELYNNNYLFYPMSKYVVYEISRYLQTYELLKAITLNTSF